MSVESSNGAKAPQWPSHVTVVDVTPRDGLQDADHLVSSEQKLAFISALLAAGVRSIEVTSFMRPEWIPQLADADYVAMQLPSHPGVTYSALIPNLRGYDRAKKTGIAEVTLVVSASESHNRANLNRSVDESLAQLATVAAQAKEDGIAVRGAIATSFGCPFEGAVAPEAVLRIVRAYAEMNVQQVSLADTIGVGNPHQVYELFLMARAELPETISLSAHFHDRAGYGLANVFAALQAGVATFDAAVGGLGGCPYAPGAPGNLSTETLVEYLEAMGFNTGISLAGLAAARQQLLTDLAHGEPVTNTHSMRK
ncbi:MAG TPA: hydroxymethylglutaryl-CoA lyase [Ktedonobacteraceae bacterium]|nr:hydroxymethylglutaryl-CoA lyase [Ktedonobacteraceae bacterium]